MFTFMKGYSFFLVVLIFFGALTGCETPQIAQFTDDELSELVPYLSLGRGLQASLDTTTTRIIEDSATWAAYADSLQPLLPFTNVNFELEIVLLAGVSVNSGGYDLRFELVENLRDTVIATYRLFSPGTDCRPSYAFGVPFEAVRIPKTDRPIRFVQVDEPVDCSPS